MKMHITPVFPDLKEGTPKPPIRSTELNHGALPDFVRKLITTEDLPNTNQSDPKLYAVIGTWYESDVVEATVKNCFANGCNKVFIIDNNSPDDTVKVAEAAGAIIGQVYKTAYYDEDLRIRITNEFIRDITEAEKIPDLWWLALDADEFPCGPNGQPLLDYLKTLHDDYSTVGTIAIDLFPTEAPYYVPGKHPADCMTHGVKRIGMKDVFCTTNHWKHPLLRYKNGVFNLCHSRGFHNSFVRVNEDKPVIDKILEPPVPIVLFHAPIRAPEHTYKRLTALCAPQDDLGGMHRSSGDDMFLGGQGAIKRWRTLNYVYAGEWDKVELPHTQIYGRDIKGVPLLDWHKIYKTVYTIPRWYPVSTSERINLL